MRDKLAGQVAALRAWDLRYSLSSVPTSLAVYWAQDMMLQAVPQARAQGVPALDYLRDSLAPGERLQSLVRASEKLERDFGTWQTPWGEINRFQRLSSDINQLYDDAKPSWPVPFASGNWGSLAVFAMAAPQKNRRIYGDRGNSFVALVEFGPRLRAKSILAGGNSGNPASPHFTDQAEMYSKGQFKDVLFYKTDILQHLERQYRPGQ